jgi:hypothetical protein
LIPEDSKTDPAATPAACRNARFPFDVKKKPAFTSPTEVHAMPLKLYAHPFSSYCQKALVALYVSPWRT